MDKAEIDLSPIEDIFKRQRETISSLRDLEESKALAENALKTHIKMEKSIIAEIRISERGGFSKKLTKDELDDLVYSNDIWKTYLTDLNKLDRATRELDPQINEKEREYESRRQRISIMNKEISIL